MMGPDVAGINSCSDFKAFHMSIDIGLGCQSIFSGDILAAMRLNHIYFQVTSIGPFTADWDRLLAFQLFSLSQFFSQPVSVSGICQFLQINNGVHIIINIVSHNWAQHRYQCPISGVLCAVSQTNGLTQPAFLRCLCTHMAAHKHLTHWPSLPHRGQWPRLFSPPIDNAFPRTISLVPSLSCEHREQRETKDKGINWEVAVLISERNYVQDFCWAFTRQVDLPTSPLES